MGKISPKKLSCKIIFKCIKRIIFLPIKPQFISRYYFTPTSLIHFIKKNIAVTSSFITQKYKLSESILILLNTILKEVGVHIFERGESDQALKFDEHRKLNYSQKTFFRYRNKQTSYQHDK